MHLVSKVTKITIVSKSMQFWSELWRKKCTSLNDCSSIQSIQSLKVTNILRSWFPQSQSRCQLFIWIWIWIGVLITTTWYYLFTCIYSVCTLDFGLDWIMYCIMRIMHIWFDLFRRAYTRSFWLVWLAQTRLDYRSASNWS